MNHFKKFHYEFDKKVLLDFYNLNLINGTVQNVGPYLHADHKLLINDRLPFFDIINKNANEQNFGISKIVNETGYHINPRNNGLIIMPLEGELIIDFFGLSSAEIDENFMGKKMSEELKIKVKNTFLNSITVDQPTAFDGKIIHNFIPKDSYFIFYAVKIPSNIPWVEVFNKL